MSIEIRFANIWLFYLLDGEWRPLTGKVINERHWWVLYFSWLYCWLLHIVLSTFCSSFVFMFCWMFSWKHLIISMFQLLVSFSYEINFFLLLSCDCLSFLCRTVKCSWTTLCLPCMVFILENSEYIKITGRLLLFGS